MLRYSILILTITLFSFSAIAHPWKPRHYVIIDTDGGFDDMRAITLMLTSPEIRVVAIIASSGVLPARETYKQIKELLELYNHEGILTGINTNFESANDCPAALKFRWGIESSDTLSHKEALEIISFATDHSEERLELVCLGSLNTAAQIHEKLLNIKSKIKTIFWSTDLYNLEQGFNYKIDAISYKTVLENAPNLVLVNCSNPAFSWDLIAIPENKTGKTAYEQNFYRSIGSIQNKFSQVCYDENIVLFLHDNYTLFEIDSINNLKGYALKDGVSTEMIKQRYAQILKGESLVRNQVFKQIPVDTSLYLSDVQIHTTELIERYGKEEWQAAVLANEMHRHLGVVATVGVKMGIRAREYFGAGLDELYVISHAGLKPPISCMNDGLQVSTGATVGHGLIEADTTSFPKTEAVFVYMGRKLKITLKEEYNRKMISELREATLLYGLSSDNYWDYVRQLAIKYWVLWDRFEIFDILEN